MKSILTIQNIHKSFAYDFKGISGKNETEWSEVLKGISINIKQAETTAIIGTNGSGKSTLFNIISGLLKPNNGTISYVYENNTFELTNIPEYQHARIGIARLFQGSNIFPNLSVLENMLVADNNRFGEQPWHIFLPTKKSEKFRIDEAEHILQNLLGNNNPLWQMRNDFAGNLSIGQQRLLAFARLFMNENASLFLLDEPCAGVNPDIRNTMAEMITLLQKQNKTVVLIEHNLDFVEKTCSQAIYLENGKIAFQGTVKETLLQKNVNDNYLGKEIR